MNKEISVLLPVYNVENYVERCLRSLFNNTIINKTEIIIVNDCTPDNSMKIISRICEEYPNIDVKIINNNTNKGIGYTRQVLLNNAKGKYIIFVDSDDWVENNYLELMYNKAEETQADIVGCKLIVESENGKKEIPVQEYKATSHEWIIDWETDKLSNWLPTRLIRRETVIKNNISFSENINWGEDTIFLTQLYTKNITVTHIDDVIYHYIRHNDSLSKQLTNEIKAEHLVNVISFFENILRATYKNDDEVFLYIGSLKANRKKAIICNGTRKTQKKFISIWPEINPAIKESNMKTLDKIILGAKYKTISLLLLLCRSLIKAVLVKDFSLQKYFS